jgi:hypothetical protein
MESVKAGAAAVAGGIACSVPLILASPLVNTDALLAVGADVVSALLFGVTYRCPAQAQRRHHLCAKQTLVFWPNAPTCRPRM